jgi:hypothetical protein
MTRAQEQLAALAEWIKQSSARYPTPLAAIGRGRDWVEPGPYAVFVPQPLDASPTDSFAPRHLPLWIPEQQAIPGLPPAAQDEPENQNHVADRLRHLIWMFQSERFRGALIPLTDPAEPLQVALDGHTPGLDLGEHLAVFLPLWNLTGEHRAWADAQLPLVRV